MCKPRSSISMFCLSSLGKCPHFYCTKEERQTSEPATNIYSKLVCQFRFPVLPNLPWRYFHRSQIFGALKQMQNEFQGGACTTQLAQ